MLRNRLHRTTVVVFALAAVAFTASGVPDNKGTDAAIGWFGFLALAVAFLVLVGVTVARAVRGRSRAAAAR